MMFSRIYGEGQAIVIIHGLFGMSDNWNSLGKKISNNYNVHIIDLETMVDLFIMLIFHMMICQMIYMNIYFITIFKNPF